jgi:hypothetical protein
MFQPGILCFPYAKLGILGVVLLVARMEGDHQHLSSGYTGTPKKAPAAAKQAAAQLYNARAAVASHLLKQHGIDPESQTQNANPSQQGLGRGYPYDRPTAQQPAPPQQAGSSGNAYPYDKPAGKGAPSTSSIGRSALDEAKQAFKVSGGRTACSSTHNSTPSGSW